MKKFEGKTAIITGSAGGMGAGTAEAFAAEGANVVIVDLKKEGRQLSDELNQRGCKTIFVETDMADEESIRAMFQQSINTYGTVDILFNNVGVLSITGLLDLSIAEWERTFRINVTSALILTQLAAPYLKKNKGVIINTSSVAGYGAHHGFAAYVASKHAMNGLTKSMAWELGPDIRVNAIAPGAIHTPMVDSIGGLSAIEFLTRGSPLKRVGQPEDIANVAMFLASPEAGFVTGQVLRVDGGIEI